MKRLDKKQKARHEELSGKLTETRDALSEAIVTFNAEVSALHAKLLQPKVEAVNGVIGEINTFVEEIHGEQESYYEERTDNWREGDAGSEYESWMSTWDVTLDELELEEPVPFDDVELDVAEFENLEQEVSS